MTHPTQNPPPFGPGGQRPKRNRAGLLIGIASGVAVVIAAVLVTGLAWPGWMISSTGGTASAAGPTSARASSPPFGDHSGGHTSPTGDATSHRSSATNTPKSVAQQAVDAANRRDIDAMVDLRCTSTTKKERRSALKNLTNGDVRWSIVSPPTVAGDKAAVKIEVSGVKSDGEHATVTKSLGLKKIDGAWCMS